MPDQAYNSVVLPCWVIDPEHTPVDRDKTFCSGRFFKPRATFAQLHNTLIEICATDANANGATTATQPTPKKPQDSVKSDSQQPCNYMTLTDMGTSTQGLYATTSIPSGTHVPGTMVTEPNLPPKACRGIDENDFPVEVGHTGANEANTASFSTANYIAPRAVVQTPSLYALSGAQTETVLEGATNTSTRSVRFIDPPTPYCKSSAV
jgi:hypothetical protein